MYMKRQDRLPEPYIWLQDDEQIGMALCGCMVDYDAEQAARLWQCNLHENAHLLLGALKNLCLTIECEPKGSPNITAAMQGAYNVIERAKI